MSYHNAVNYDGDDCRNPGQRATDFIENTQGRDSSVTTETVEKANESRILSEGMNESGSNLYKIHQLVFKKSSFIKEPVLYSKDIKV